MRLIILFLILALYSCSDKPTPGQNAAAPLLPVLQIVNSAATTYQEFPASIEGSSDVEIRPQVTGILDKLYVEEGAFVNAGTPLFKINESPYREKLNNAKASLLAAQGAEANARIEVNKLKPLVANKVISDYQLKTAQSSLTVAQANVGQAKADVAAAQINVGYTIIKAPVSGYIGRLKKKKGSLVSITDPDALTQLSDVRNVHVYFSLGENDFVNFKDQYSGSTIEDKIKNLPPVTLVLSNNKEYELKGKIDIIDGQFDKNTGAITVRANFSNTKGLLRSGNTGRIRLDLKYDNAVVIPQSSTFEMQDKTFVFVVGKDNKVKKEPIVISGKSGENYIIGKGLKVGEKIVIDGLGTLQEGTIINPVTPAKSPVAQTNKSY
jgi:membrane fusion protein (multidrug efflux system)